MAGWSYFELERPVPLESLKPALGGSDETQVVIAFSGPEQVVAPRSFEYLRSTDEVRGLLWSVSGGTLRLDIPGQQANPGQEFIVLKIRATNPAPAEVRMRNERAGAPARHRISSRRGGQRRAAPAQRRAQCPADRVPSARRAGLALCLAAPAGQQEPEIGHPVAGRQPGAPGAGPASAPVSARQPVAGETPAP